MSNRVNLNFKLFSENYNINKQVELNLLNFLRKCFSLKISFYTNNANLNIIFLLTFPI